MSECEVEIKKKQLKQLRNAFGQFMTGVTVVTTCQQDDAPIGFTANSFSSVSLDPALLLVSIAKTSSNYAHFMASGHFAVNILTAQQVTISNTFACPSNDRFASISWRRSVNNNPIIDDVSTWFDCILHQVVDAGDHAILIGKIEDFASQEQIGLGYYQGGYIQPIQIKAIQSSAPKTILSTIIGHKNSVLLVQQADYTWTIPQLTVDAQGTEQALSDIFSQYQPTTSSRCIYAVYDNIPQKTQHMTFLCQSTSDLAQKGQFFSLDDLEKIQFSDQALYSMLLRYRAENQLQHYGTYYGNHATGTIYQISSMGV